MLILVLEGKQNELELKFTCWVIVIYIRVIASLVKFIIHKYTEWYDSNRRMASGLWMYVMFSGLTMISLHVSQNPGYFIIISIWFCLEIKSKMKQVIEWFLIWSQIFIFFLGPVSWAIKPYCFLNIVLLLNLHSLLFLPLFSLQP